MNTDQSNQKTISLDSGKLIHLLLNNMKIIILCTIIITILGTIYAFTATPWYKADVKILPPETGDNMLLRQYASIAALAGVDIPMGGAGYHYFYPEILKSDIVLDKVLKQKFWSEKKGKKLTLFEIWETDIDSSENDWEFKLFEKTKKKLRQVHINAEMNELTELLTVSVIFPSEAIFASSLVNFLINEIDIYNKTMRKSKAKEQRIFIENTLSKNSSELENAEEKLKEFEIMNKDFSSPTNKLIYQRLNTDAEIHRTIVIELRKQLELIKIEEVKQTPTLNIIEKSNKPFQKIKPKRLILIIISFTLGLFLGITIVILRELYPNLKMRFISVKRLNA